MKKSLIKILFCVLTISLSTAQAQQTSTTPAAKPTATSSTATPAPTTKPNYETLSSNLVPANLKTLPHQILVLDFFSFGCPHCYKLHSYIDQWVAANTKKILPPFGSPDKKAKPYITFQPVPVAFESGWDVLSKAYHISHALKLDKTLNGKIFDIAQNPLLGLNSDEQLRSFFLNNGVKAEDYDKVANSAELQADLKNDQALMQAFKIMEIPTVIVIKDGKVYYISNRTVANADPSLFITTLTQLTQNT
ncbi:MAG: thiol:disulfide interchange protein [Gammaproteobacteria bacterium]|jgi:thiol:disulfide interchange protein DsbA|nr:thiol:disulfide interchange protein [Gammaproteobacteria bacterium]